MIWSQFEKVIKNFTCFFYGFKAHSSAQNCLFVNLAAQKNSLSECLI